MSKFEEEKTYIENGNLVSEIEGYYEMVAKNSENEPEVFRLRKHSIKTRPIPTDIEQHFVRQAPEVNIRASRKKPTSRTDKLTVCLADFHIPFEDKEAMGVAHNALVDWQPDEIVLLGDNLDLPAQSKFETRKEWVDLTQTAIDGLHTYLSQMRADNPNAKITWLDSNHDKRLEMDIRRNAGELLGLRRANAEKELGVLTLSYLMRLGELEIDFIAGYPRADYYIEDNLKAIHGDIIRNNGSTASAIVSRENVSTVFGHSHRIELASKTVNHRNGARFIIAASFGTLADISGSVPSYSYATDEQAKVVRHYENWQHGLGVIEHNGSVHQITPIHIQDGQFIYGGKVYQAR